MRSIGKAVRRGLSPSNRGQITWTSRGLAGLYGLGRPEALTQLQAMENVGTVYAIVSAQAQALAMNRWRMWRKAESGDDADRAEVTRHQALKVWAHPNPVYNGQELREAQSQHLLLTGEAWLWVNKIPGLNIPGGLWLVRPDLMQPVQHPTKFISGYVFNSPDGTKVPIELDEMIYLKIPNPSDPYRGLSPVKSILTDLQATVYAGQYNRNFFANDASPGGIITVPDVMGDEEYRMLRARWDEQHRGAANAHKAAILEGGMQWQDIKYTMRDMQFAELRQVSREIIRESFRFPVPMLGTSENVNRANADAAEVVFARWLIKPALERVKQMLNDKFLPMFYPPGMDIMDIDTEFDYDNPVPEDLEMEAKLLAARSTAAKDLVEAGFDRAGALSAVGLPDIPVAAAPAMQAPAEGGGSGG